MADGGRSPSWQEAAKCNGIGASSAPRRCSEPLRIANDFTSSKNIGKAAFHVASFFFLSGTRFTDPCHSKVAAAEALSSLLLVAALT